MEEPPARYHFILLAEHAEQILPTIKSRCTIHMLSSETLQDISHPLVEVFTKKMVASNEFTKILDATTINERETMELLDDIISYWLQDHQQQKRELVSPLITKLQKASLQPPMPGSSVAFWRNLYLQVHKDLFF
jgi:DNA polymerase III gamma/tau subunit